MAVQLFTNNAATTLDTGIDGVVTSLNVSSGDGAMFPSPTGGDWFYVTLELGTTREIVKVTTRATDTFTIVRGQDGTSATSWVAGATIELRVTQAFLNTVLTTDTNPTIGDVTGPASAVDDRVAVFDGTTGKVIKDGGVLISGSNTGDQTLPIDSTLVVTDNTGNDVTASAHGFAPKSSGTSTEYLSGTGVYSTPAGGSGDVVGPASAVDNRVAVFDGVTGKLIKDGGVAISGSNTGDQTLSDATITTTDITTNDVTSSKHGFAPKLSGTSTEYLSGTGVYSTPAGGGGGTDAKTSVYPEFTEGTNDDEFDDESFTGWTTIEGTTPLVTLTELNDVCSINHPGGDAAAELHSFMKTVTPGTNDFIETVLMSAGENQAFNIAGLIMADGNTHGAGAQVAFYHSPQESRFAVANFTNYTTLGSLTSLTTKVTQNSNVFLRLKYEGSNNWSGWTSSDGVSWINVTGTVGKTMTPTHIGFFVTTWGGSNPQSFTFRYFKHSS